MIQCPQKTRHIVRIVFRRFVNFVRRCQLIKNPSLTIAYKAEQIQVVAVRPIFLTASHQLRHTLRPPLLTIILLCFRRAEKWRVYISIIGSDEVVSEACQYRRFPAPTLPLDGHAKIGQKEGVSLGGSFAKFWCDNQLYRGTNLQDFQSTRFFTA